MSPADLSACRRGRSRRTFSNRKPSSWPSFAPGSLPWDESKKRDSELPDLDRARAMMICSGGSPSGSRPAGPSAPREPSSSAPGGEWWEVDGSVVEVLPRGGEERAKGDDLSYPMWLSGEGEPNATTAAEATVKNQNLSKMPI